MKKYCCEAMEKWSNPKVEPIIHHSKIGTNVGIRVNAGGNAFVTMRYCPWCGHALKDVAEELVGKRVVEAR